MKLFVICLIICLHQYCHIEEESKDAINLIQKLPLMFVSGFALVSLIFDIAIVLKLRSVSQQVNPNETDGSGNVKSKCDQGSGIDRCNMNILL